MSEFFDSGWVLQAINFANNVPVGWQCMIAALTTWFAGSGVWGMVKNTYRGIKTGVWCVERIRTRIRENRLAKIAEKERMERLETQVNKILCAFDISSDKV